MPKVNGKIFGYDVEGMKAAQEEADRSGSIIEYTDKYKKGGSTSKRKKKKTTKNKY